MKYLFAELACDETYQNDSGFIASPSYPNSYPPARDCIYLINQSNGTFIDVQFVDIDVVCREIFSTSDYIEIRDGNSEHSPLMGKFCGNQSSLPPSMQTTSNYMRIR